MSKELLNQAIDNILQFEGPFKDLITGYIQYKRAQGYKMSKPICYRLREMDLFFLEMGIQEPRITREMYEAWTMHRPGQKETTTQKRQNAIRGFAKYLVSLGYTDVYTGYDDTRIIKSDFIPYIFSREETDKMFRILRISCEQFPCYENDTFRLSILMYYCCGFRRSELTNLLMQDFDFHTGTITVLHGKNDVSRQIPVSDSLWKEILAYREKYLSDAGVEDYFFYPEKKRETAGDILYKKFHQLLKESGIPPRADGRRQRLHDIRHTFCVMALEQMQEKGFDLYTSLPLLSVYLGHKHITETEYYLRMVEEHFEGILSRTEFYAPNIFPKYEENAE